MKILITGANGFLATNIRKKLSKYNFQCITKKDFNLLDSKSVNDFFKDKYFDVVLHCAILGGNRLIEETKDIVFDNIKLTMNLMMNKNSFGKLIHFGSGAELDRNQDINANHKNFKDLLPEDPYGFSKNMIARLLDNADNTYNLRIFTIVAEDESERRMVKGNILNYINKRSIQIHQDKFMDFMYIDDFIQILDKYIKNSSLPKEIDCVYDKKYKLSDIANLINKMSDYTVAVDINNDSPGYSYCGKFYDLDLEYIGLEKAIENVYNSMLSTNQQIIEK